MLQFFVVMEDFTTKHLRVAQEIQQSLSQRFIQEAESFRSVNHIDFDAGYGPENDEIFKVSPFTLPEQFKNCAIEPLSCDHIKREELKPGAIRAIVGVSTRNGEQVEQAIFKRIDKSKVIDRSKTAFVMHEEDTLNIPRDNTLVVPDRVDAVYESIEEQDLGDLYFFSHYSTRQFLPLEQVFQEATTVEIDGLLSEQHLICDDREAFEEALDSWSRRRISMIMKRPIWHRVAISRIKTQAGRFGVTITTRQDGETGQEVIVLPHQRGELKNVLRVLNEDLVQAQLTSNRWQINSKKPVQ